MRYTHSKKRALKISIDRFQKGGLHTLHLQQKQ